MTQLNDLVEDITMRLRPVCAGWPDELFAEMVRRMAEITLKYEHPHETEIAQADDAVLAEMRALVDKSEEMRQRAILMSDEPPFTPDAGEGPQATL